MKKNVEWSPYKKPLKKELEFFRHTIDSDAKLTPLLVSSSDKKEKEHIFLYNHPETNELVSLYVQVKSGGRVKFAATVLERRKTARKAKVVERSMHAIAEIPGIESCSCKKEDFDEQAVKKLNEKQETALCNLNEEECTHAQTYDEDTLKAFLDLGSEKSSENQELKEKRKEFITMHCSQYNYQFLPSKASFCCLLKNKEGAHYILTARHNIENKLHAKYTLNHNTDTIHLTIDDVSEKTNTLFKDKKTDAAILKVTNEKLESSDFYKNLLKFQNNYYPDLAAAKNKTGEVTGHKVHVSLTKFEGEENVTPESPKGCLQSSYYRLSKPAAVGTSGGCVFGDKSSHKDRLLGVYIGAKGTKGYCTTYYSIKEGLKNFVII